LKVIQGCAPSETYSFVTFALTTYAISHGLRAPALDQNGLVVTSVVRRPFMLAAPLEKAQPKALETQGLAPIIEHVLLVIMSGAD